MSNFELVVMAVMALLIVVSLTWLICLIAKYEREIKKEDKHQADMRRFTDKNWRN